ALGERAELIILEQLALSLRRQPFIGGVENQRVTIAPGFAGEREGIAAQIARDIGVLFPIALFTDEQVDVAVEAEKGARQRLFLRIKNDRIVLGRLDDFGNRQRNGADMRAKAEGLLCGVEAELAVMLAAQELGLLKKEHFAVDLRRGGRLAHGFFPTQMMQRRPKAAARRLGGG